MCHLTTTLLGKITLSVTYEIMSMVNFLNDYDRGQPNNSERNLSDCYSAYHKSQNNWPSIKTAPPKL